MALGTPIVKWMIIHGGPYGISRPGAVSFCNLLFVGNICAAFFSLIFYGHKKIVGDIKRLNIKEWGLILVITLISAISSMLMFISLEKLTVVNVVLVQRLDGVFYALFALIIFQEKPRKIHLLSYAFILLGISIQIYLVNHGEFSKPVFLLIIATVLFSINPVFHKIIMKSISAEAMLFLVKLISAILFFLIAVKVFGLYHFADLTKGKLWLGLSVYALLIIFIGSMFWYEGVKQASTRQLSNMMLLVPVASIVFAFVFLGEKLNYQEATAVVIVITGLLIEQFKPQKRKKHLPKESPLRGNSVDRSLIGQ